MSVKTIFISFFYVLVLLWNQSAQALGDGDSLEFGDGSYFGVEILPGFIIQTPIESFNGIIIGQEQPASGSHAGMPDGSEEPSIDKPWAFFGNTGMFQTVAGGAGVAVIGDDGNGSFELAFNGFGATWSGIPNIDLSGSSAFPSDTGIATMTCTTVACDTGSSYVLDYSAHVPPGDPSGFGGVLFVVHLEGNVGIAPDILSLVINVPGGSPQECTQEGGSIVEMNATAIVPADDEVLSILWKIDGNEAGTGESISPFLSLGNHTVTAVLLTQNGLSTGDIANVDVNDTTRPEIIAEFVSAATGQVVTQVDKSRRIELRVGADDICDPDPVVTSSELKKNESVSVQDGDSFVALPNGKTNIYQFDESLRLSVSARDASGNTNSKAAILGIAR